LCDRIPGTISFEALDGASKLFGAIFLIVDSFTFWDIDPAGYRTIELLYAPEIGGAIRRNLELLYAGQSGYRFSYQFQLGQFYNLLIY
jgi:hypothetical protein